jgi:hypothetical protein
MNTNSCHLRSFKTESHNICIPNIVYLLNVKQIHLKNIIIFLFFCFIGILKPNV